MARPSTRGLLLLLAFASLGTGLVLWARNLLPGPRRDGQPGRARLRARRRRAAIVESLSRGTEAMMSRRGFLVKKVLVPVGGIFGIAAIWPLASLGIRPGDALYHTKWYPGAQAWSPRTATPCTWTTSWWTGSSRCSPRGT